MIVEKKLTREEFNQIFNCENENYKLIEDTGLIEEGSGYGKHSYQIKIFKHIETNEYYQLNNDCLFWGEQNIKMKQVKLVYEQKWKEVTI